MNDVTMVMVVALTVKDEDEKEKTVAAQGVVHKGMMMGTRVHGIAGRTRYDTTHCSKEGIGQGMLRRKKNKFKVILQRAE